MIYHSSWKNTIFQYVLIVFLTVAYAFVCLRLWEVNLSQPLLYGKDYIFTTAMAKGISEGGSIFVNPNLGAPFGGVYYDFPNSDGLHIFFITIMIWVFKNAILSVNLYYLLGFPLTACLSYYVFRKFKLPFNISILGSMAFTFLPYHFYRLLHIFLSEYYLLPISIMLAIMAYIGKLPLYKYNIPKRSVLIHKNFWLALVACIAIGSSGIYYAFFVIVILLFLSIRSLIQKRYNRLLSIITLIAFIFISVLGNLAPSIVYQWRQGPPLFSITARAPEGSEIYGLKIIQLLIPSPIQLVGKLSSITQLYNSSAPLVNENSSSSLGIIGSLGFIFSLAITLFPILQNTIEKELGLINIICLLLAQVGGIGTVIAYSGFTSIRAYNRISIIIGFISILTFCLILYRIFKILNEKYGNNRIFSIFLSGYQVLLLFIILFDQFPIWNKPDSSTIAEDQMFVNKIEEILPLNSMIFQLPYMGFPEEPPEYHMADYDPLKLYVLSTSLRWSYGGIKNREAGLWYKEVASLPTNKMLDTISKAGFFGIVIDRNGYSDGDRNSVEAEIQKLLKITPLLSHNNRYAFYDIRRYASHHDLGCHLFRSFS